MSMTISFNFIQEKMAKIDMHVQLEIIFEFQVNGLQGILLNIKFSQRIIFKRNQ